MERTWKKAKMPLPDTFKPTAAKHGMPAHQTNGSASKKPAGRSSAKRK